jgi:uncharacterized membrane protein YphA (DoxX/SURF4 family)
MLKYFYIFEKYLFSPRISTELGFARAVFLLLFYWYHRGGQFQFQPGIEAQDFWEPISFFKLFDLKAPSMELLQNLSFIWKFAIVCAALGFMTRFHVLVTVVLSLYLFGIGMNYGKIDHPQTMPLVVMMILAFSRSGDGFSIDSLINRASGLKRLKLSPSYGWPFRLIQIYIVWVYFSAGFQKLRVSGLEWVFSDNLQSILLRAGQESGAWFATYPNLCILLALMTIIVEFGAPLALLGGFITAFFVLGFIGLHLGTFWLMGNDAAFIAFIFPQIFWVRSALLFQFVRR